MIRRIELKRDFQKHRDAYLAAIRTCCEESAFSGGKYAEQFERQFAEYIGVPFVQGVNNGTSAIHCALTALGIGGGDEVIVPANTYIATAWGVTYTGATPVFVDCTEDTWEIDPSKIEDKITKRTKAILGVHLYGQPFEFDEVKKIADKYGLYVVEDCAQAHGAKYKGRNAGTLGSLGCFSFYPGKNLYAFGEGGCVTTSEKKWNDYIDIMKNQGSATRYQHEIIGYNYRMEGIQGAILSVSLGYLDGWNRRRKEIAERYLTDMVNPQIRMQAHPEETESVFHLFEIETAGEPEDFISYMASREIECNRHYPVPCHLQKAYKNLGYKKGDCPNAEYLADHCVTLPLFPEMTEEEIEAVIQAVNSYK